MRGILCFRGLCFGSVWKHILGSREDGLTVHVFNGDRIQSAVVEQEWPKGGLCRCGLMMS